MINLARIAKNLVLFPIESVLIALLLGAALPVLRAHGLVQGQTALRPRRRDLLLAGGLFLLSVGLVLFYIFFLKDFLAAHNVKWW